MSNRNLGALTLTAGVLVFLIALSADPLGLGLNQVALGLVAVTAAASGMAMLRSR